MPSWSPIPLAASGTGSATATSRAPLRRRAMFRAWTRPMVPAPISPIPRRSPIRHALGDQRPHQPLHRPISPLRGDRREELDREYPVVSDRPQGAVEAVQPEHALAGQDTVRIAQQLEVL